MKTPKLILLSCLLLAFSTNIFLGSAQNPPAPVLDTAGQELHRGVNYYILPAESGIGGGLTLANGRNGTCPYEIVRTLNGGANGLSLRFSPVNTSDSEIRVSTDLNIKFNNFSAPEVCPQSNVWMLDADSQPAPPVFVTTGGVEGNPGEDTIFNWFKIQRYEDAYQLEFCPSVTLCGGNPCRLLCGYIGAVLDNGRRRLALHQRQFKIVFQRA